ncbi:hypothetical protein ACLK1T_07350 [Escherichia coli]
MAAAAAVTGHFADISTLNKEHTMAEKFIKRTGLVVPLDAANVDTDANHPETVFAESDRTGFGAHLFDDWRFLDEKANNQTRTSC